MSQDFPNDSQATHGHLPRSLRAVPPISIKSAAVKFERETQEIAGGVHARRRGPSGLSSSTESSYDRYRRLPTLTPQQSMNTINAIAEELGPDFGPSPLGSRRAASNRQLSTFSTRAPGPPRGSTAVASRFARQNQIHRTIALGPNEGRYPSFRPGAPGAVPPSAESGLVHYQPARTPAPSQSLYAVPAYPKNRRPLPQVLERPRPSNPQLSRRRDAQPGNLQKGGALTSQRPARGEPQLHSHTAEVDTSALRDQRYLAGFF